MDVRGGPSTLVYDKLPIAPVENDEKPPAPALQAPFKRIQADSLQHYDWKSLLNVVDTVISQNNSTLGTLEIHNSTGVRERKTFILVSSRELCGNEADFAIDFCCLAAPEKGETARQPPQSLIMSSVLAPEVCVFAPCCHSRMKWESYCNKPYLESLGIGPASFRSMIRLIELGRGKLSGGTSVRSTSTSSTCADCVVDGGGVGSFAAKRLRDLRTLDDATIRNLSRWSRRLIEEGRMRRFRE